MDRIPLETVSEESEIRFRDCFSVRYIQSAALLCRLGHSIEKEYAAAGELSAESALMHEAFILNSILSAVAFLESTVNELYSDAADSAPFSPDRETEAVYQSIRDRWRNEKNFDRAPLLTRYQRVLALTGRQPFLEADPAFANVRNLLEIRNFLLHYRREWVVLGKIRHHRGDGKTQAERFETLLKHAFCGNPLAGRDRPFFPDRCLGHGCAEWAVINSLIFADEFFSRLGLPAPYEGVRNELQTR